MKGADSADTLRAGGADTPPALHPTMEGQAPKTDTVAKAIKTPRAHKYLVCQRIRASLTEDEAIRTSNTGLRVEFPQ
jgi:hypothetical protein